MDNEALADVGQMLLHHDERSSSRITIWTGWRPSVVEEVPGRLHGSFIIGPETGEATLRDVPLRPLTCAVLSSEHGDMTASGSLPCPSRTCIPR